MGEIRSWKRQAKGGRASKPHTIKAVESGRWGGLSVHIYKDGHRKQIYVHRLILETFVGPCPEGMECRHKNGNPRDNRLENLEWNTHKVNIQDRADHNKTARGEHNGFSKLTEKEALLLKRCLNYNMDERWLAGMFNLSYTHVNNIKRGRAWRHIKP